MKLSTAHCLLFTILLLGCSWDQTPAPLYKYALGQGAGTTGIHTVSWGETIWDISKRYDIAARDIIAANSLTPPFFLAPGQRIKLPPPQTYTARDGDTIGEVSQLFGVGAYEIVNMNDLHEPFDLHAGQVLRLPSVTQMSQPTMFAAQAVTKFSVQDAPQGLAMPQGSIQAESLAAPSVKTSAQSLSVAVPKPIEKIDQASAPLSPVTAKVPARASDKFLMPVRGDIISGYGPKAGGLYNDGINIKAAEGAPVKAGDNGVVVYAGNELKGSGNLVLIRHEGKWMTAYAHLKNITVARGQVVKRGQMIGGVGSTGSVNSPQLHFEVRRGAEAINPQMFVES